MDTYFELWDLRSGNHAGDFDREEDALSLLASILSSDGPQSVADYGPSEGPDPNDSNPAYSGDALVQRVLAFSRGELASLLRNTA